MSLSISSLSQDPYQALQRLSDQQAATGSAPGACGGGMQQNSGSASADVPPATEGGGHHRHHHGGGAGEAVSKLLDIIGSALESAQSTGQDPNKVIEDTVAQLLSGGADAATGDGTTPATDTTTTDPTTPTGATPTTGQQSFTELLQSFGVSLDQFRADLLAAVQDAQQGQVNPGTALQSLPAGASVDSIA